jgi:hypothetical protein
VLDGYLRASGKGIPRQELQEVFEAMRDEISLVMDDRSAIQPPDEVDLGASTMIIGAPNVTRQSRHLSGSDYSCSTSGAVLKLVHCECCEAQYVYRMERSAKGQGTSVWFLNNAGAARAASEADTQLRCMLERDVDPVPCPKCGWYQQNMLRSARSEQGSRLLYVGVCFTLAFIPAAVIGLCVNFFVGRGGQPVVSGPVFLACSALWVVFGLSLILAGFIVAVRYDPNTQDLEARKLIGQTRAKLREEFEKLAE